MSATASFTRDDKTMACLVHLSAFIGWFTAIFSWLPPLVFFLIYRDRSRTVAEHAKEALNFQLSLVLYFFVAWLLCYVLIGLFILPVLFFLALILPIAASVAASDGRAYRYPVTIRFVS